MRKKDGERNKKLKEEGISMQRGRMKAGRENMEKLLNKEGRCV